MAGKNQNERRRRELMRGSFHVLCEAGLWTWARHGSPEGGLAALAVVDSGSARQLQLLGQAQLLEVIAQHPEHHELSFGLCGGKGSVAHRQRLGAHIVAHSDTGRLALLHEKGLGLLALPDQTLSSMRRMACATLACRRRPTARAAAVRWPGNARIPGIRRYRPSPCSRRHHRRNRCPQQAAVG